jgi:hypothetical protein
VPHSGDLAVSGIGKMRHMVASVVRTVFVLALAAGVISVLTGGPLRVSLAPNMKVIATKLGTEHALPKGTKLKVGYPDDPLVLAYDKKGRVVLTPPRKKTLVDVFRDSMKGLGLLKAREGADVASRDPVSDFSEE